MNKLSAGTLIAFSAFLTVARAEDAGQILSATGVKGGLVVHVGCGDGKLTAALRANDGKTLAQYKLDGLPVFDTMAAANGRLYVATTDGKVRCYAGK